MYWPINSSDSENNIFGIYWVYAETKEDAIQIAARYCLEQALKRENKHYYAITLHTYVCGWPKREITPGNITVLE